MQTKFIEASGNGPSGGNWGKFLVGRFEPEELARRSKLPEIPADGSLLGFTGWDPKMVWVLDLQTREGAAFRPGGDVAADLNKHAVWVCPLFEPFLGWLYQQDLTDLDALPGYVDLPDAEFAMAGYRRPGPDPFPHPMPGGSPTT